MPPTKSLKAPRKTGLRKVPFTVKAEGAREVVLTGDFLKWSKEGIRLVPEANGEWKTLLELAPGEYQYRIIVDGEWRDHSEAPARIPNPYGTYNAILTVS